MHARPLTATAAIAASALAILIGPAIAAADTSTGEQINQPSTCTGPNGQETSMILGSSCSEVNFLSPLLNAGSSGLNSASSHHREG
ncbi:hypothetical protein AB0L82_27220 [Nocardia sp. NPDC052001]|uniref:hypothetical protein n=1 Tax=Nocardia sp. NPDC052001 TaxID=3154853 RepID=UPI0034393694